MGTIVEIERKKGMTYKAEVRRKGHRPLCKTFKRKTDAQRWINEQENTIDKGGLVTMEVDRKTIRDLIQRFQEDRVGRMGVTAQRDYSTQLSWWKDQLGHLTLRHLTRSKIIEARSKLLSEPFSRGVREKKRSPATVNRYLAALSSCCSYGIELGILSVNPCTGIKSLTEPRGRTRFLSDEERERLLEVCESSSPQLHLAVVLSLATGARQREIWELTWKNVDLKNGYLTFEKTKNGEQRIVPVVGDALEWLQNYHSHHRVVGRDQVFPGRFKGEALDLRSQWESALKKAEIKDFRWHDLRHSCASYLVRQGVDIRLIAELLGHKSLQMSFRYSHLAKEHLKTAIGGAMLRAQGGTYE
ncbi:MAG: tyrosine-type recombinase/integrase [Opitutales bacterium]